MRGPGGAVRRELGDLRHAQLRDVRAALRQRAAVRVGGSVLKSSSLVSLIQTDRKQQNR